MKGLFGDFFNECVCVLGHSVIADSLQPHQAPLSMEFSRQEYWSGLPFPGTNTETAEMRDG